ncbi:nicotinate-nicotinamide nucleotide adenylyltransferase [Acinetobacter sp. ANC 4648]|uniref:nicotinate-nicotinamide nucleotide adenylyltransferase n=1 Tax=Acinetobacter sp. ANC 4648 TaxID=1977875 RepID=UPI000A34124F|nr:nicotinate-nicotinamide nucleotide adenylyltransferase [Acinetobacter sp. ANC 4648]OTG81785.1 nicotinamide-nucleotide adenylyltransferase [Acinetobacter sp. ANC 4648]
MKYNFDYLIYIGRFQPFHLAHMQTIKIALEQSYKIILALGSAQDERNTKNPFTALEREQMILSNFSESDQKRIQFVHLIDVYNDVKWIKLVKNQVAARVELEDKIGLIGHFKDESSYYLQLFPEWEMLKLESLKGSISATPLREAYYRGEIVESAFPLGTSDFLHQFQTTEIFKQLQHKYQTQDKSNL